MSMDDYRWHYDYARLAWDLGFTFQTLRAKPSLDKNTGHIDIEQVIRERDVATIERHIGTVIEFNLDNDQTSVLDPTFVKIFRLSQLSVQYLLFCKKYLDNTVVLIKKEFTKNNEESKNLKRYVEELKQEVANSKKQTKELKSALSCQIASTQNVPVFQCNECPKAFSTEEYLLAHIKRRHDTQQGASSTSFQAETDKLQLEIKALKERLNNTEKFIHSDEPNHLKKDASSNFLIKNSFTENSLLADLQQKFELLKNHVENELCILQTQKFDQDKYEQWFETFLRKLEHTHGKEIGAINKKSEENTFGSKETVVPNNDVGEKPTIISEKNPNHSESNDQKQNSAIIVRSIENSKNIEEIRKNDGTTQTDFNTSQEPVICKNCQAKHSPTLKRTQVEQLDSQIRSDSNGENTQQKLHSETENHLEKFEEMLEKKVTGSLEKIENQMQSFWNKMNEAEKQKLHIIEPISDVQQQTKNKSNTSIQSVDVKPQKAIPKPRKRVLTKETAFKPTTQQKANESVIKIKPKPRKIIRSTQVQLSEAPVIETITFKEAGINFNANSETESEISEESESSESSDEETDNDNMNKQPKVTTATLKPSNTSTLGQRSLTSLKEAAFTPEVLQGLQNEVESVLNSRLKEIGISPEWSTLPIRSYQRALNIVTHQASVIQKNIANYMHIRGQILNDVDQQVLARKKISMPQKHSKVKSLLSNVRNKTKAVVQNEKSLNKLVNINADVTIANPQKSKIQKTRVPEKEQNIKDEKPKPSQRMYEMDTDSDGSIIEKKSNAWNRLKITEQTQKAYFDVIQELNTAVNKKAKVDDQESVSEISEAIIPIKELPEMTKKDEIDDDNNSDIKIETQAKGVLKSYPSIGSLQKKKVLFDLESSVSDNKEPPKPTVPLKTNDGGSTTSVASSVLDGSKTNLTQKISDKIPNELSDVSDWDLSDILD